MKKYISLNILSILGYIIIFLWIINLLTLGHCFCNWFSNPIYTLLIIFKQFLIVLSLLVLFLAEYLLKKLNAHFFLINFENKLYSFLFKLGYLFLFIPFLIVASSFILLPLIKFFNLKIIIILITIAFLLEIIIISYCFFFKKKIF